MIDYVIPFVDDSDAIWRKVFEEHVDGLLDCGRWRDWGILKYQLRSIEKYMPWVDRIFLVLSIGSSQIPKWLDTGNPKIQIVYDYDFVPKEAIPTYNSNVIELYFPRIKDLSEYYLTSCDDYLLMRPFKESEFFAKDGKIKLKMESNSFRCDIYSSTIANSVRMIFPDGVKEKDSKVTCLWANHTVTPHIKSINEAFLNEHETEVRNSLTMERDSRNLTWLIYPLNMLRMGMLASSDISVGCRRFVTMSDVMDVEFSGCDILALNDWYDDWGYEQAKQVLNEKMQTLLPDRSKFEKM